jgi:hypothetical protein
MARRGNVGVDPFGLVEANDRLDQRVVVGVANRADGGGDLLYVDVVGEPDRGVLGCPHRMVYQALI